MKIYDFRKIGLKFQEEWYVLGQGDDWRALVYRGGTLQGPYPAGGFWIWKPRAVRSVESC